MELIAECHSLHVGMDRLREEFMEHMVAHVRLPSVMTGTVRNRLFVISVVLGLTESRIKRAELTDFRGPGADGTARARVERSD